jgi:hypothetical protein
MKNLVCNNVELVNLLCNVMLYSGPAFRVGLAHIPILLYVIYRVLPSGSDRIILYYCLMATWTGLGDNTELFWAVLSQLVPER